MLPKKSEGSDLLIVALEGPDYSGKSTVSKMIVDNINNSSSRYMYQDAVHLRRPGGSHACDDLREKITNGKIPSNTRQILAFAEEVLFNYTVSPFHKIFVLDRFNPISGQVYGPEDMHIHWQWLVESGIIRLPDLVIFVDTPVSVLLDRCTREKRDVMDEYFISKAETIIKNYDRIKQSPWFNSHFKHTTVDNCGTIDDLYNSVMSIIDKEVKEKNE